MQDLLHTLVFSLISGFAEFIFTPVSAHQLLYSILTDTQLDSQTLRLAIHTGSLVALLLHCSNRLKALRAEKRMSNAQRRRHNRQADPASVMDMRIINTAAVPAILSLLIPTGVLKRFLNPGWITLFLLAYGVILFIPSVIRAGNKNARSYTMLDGLLMGLAGVFGIIPGIGRLGCMHTMGLIRGADQNYALDLSLLISIPVLIASACVDAYGVALTAVSPTGLQILGYILASIASFGGGYLSILLLRVLCRRSNTSFFAYYNWGLAAFMFLLYLIIY